MKKPKKNKSGGIKRLFIGIVLVIVGFIFLKIWAWIGWILLLIGGVFVIIGFFKIKRANEILDDIEDKIKCELFLKKKIDKHTKKK